MDPTAPENAPNLANPGEIKRRNIPLAVQIAGLLGDDARFDIPFGLANLQCLAIVALHSKPEEFAEFHKRIIAVESPEERIATLRESVYRRQITDSTRVNSTLQSTELEVVIRSLTTIVKDIQLRLASHTVNRKYVEDLISPLQEGHPSIAQLLPEESIRGTSLDKDLTDATIRDILAAMPSAQ